MAVDGKRSGHLSQPELVLAPNGNDHSRDVAYLVYRADGYIEFKREGTSSNYYRAVNGAAGPLAGAEAEALSIIGDERAVTLFQQLAKKPGLSPQMAAVIARFDARLREKLGQTKPGP